MIWWWIVVLFLWLLYKFIRLLINFISSVIQFIYRQCIRSTLSNHFIKSLLFLIGYMRYIESLLRLYIILVLMRFQLRYLLKLCFKNLMDLFLFSIRFDDRIKNIGVKWYMNFIRNRANSITVWKNNNTSNNVKLK